MNVESHNTVFLSVAAWPDWRGRIEVFLRSARKRGIPVELSDAGGEWRGYYQHKIVGLRERLISWTKIRPEAEYVVFTDARDVVFVASHEEILERLGRLDENKVTFALDNKLRTWPMNKVWLAHRISLKYGIDGIVNSGCYAGRIDKVIELLTECVRIHDALVSGVVEMPSIEAMVQRELKPEYLNSDQFHLHVAQALWSELIAVDVERTAFACFKGGFPRIRTAPEFGSNGEMPIGTAGILHSPWMLHRRDATEDHVKQWRQWAADEGIIDEQ